MDFSRNFVFRSMDVVASRLREHRPDPERLQEGAWAANSTCHRHTRLVFEGFADISLLVGAPEAGR